MNVKLKVEEDADLRAEVKDLVRGMVKSMTTDDVRQALQCEVERRAKARLDNFGDILIDDEIKKIVRSVVSNLKFGLKEEGMSDIVKRECAVVIGNYLQSAASTKFVDQEFKKAVITHIAESVGKDDVVKAAIQMLKDK